MAKKHVIVGAGPAGINAIETIRQLDGDGSEIHLICNEPPYSRMALPYFLAGKVPENHVLTGDDDYFKKLGVTTHFGGGVSGVDSSRKTVTYDGGKSLPYDNLLIATGSSALRPPIPGLDSEGVHNLWTLEDARAVVSQAKKDTKVLFVGAGFIGFIVLNALAKVGCKLSVVELESQVLPRMLDMVGGRLVADWLGSKGVNVITAASVDKISKTSKGLRAGLSTGGSVSADMVIVSVGVKPNTDFLNGSGVDIDQGIVIDENCETSVKGIYAAGDCAQGLDLSTDRKSVQAIQPTAIEHGRVAAASMTGNKANYKGSLALNILDVVDLQCASFGLWRKETVDVTSAVNHTRPSYRKLVWDGDKIVGGIILGQTSDVTTLTDLGMMKGFIQSQASLGVWKKYIQEHPLDLRRAYMGAGVGSKLAAMTLLPRPSEPRQYRFENASHHTSASEHHKTLIQGFVEAKPPEG